MSHTILNIDMITKESMRELKSQLSFTGRVNRKYDSKFAQEGAKIGDTANIRLPNRFTATDGATLNLQNITERSVGVVINKQKHVGFQFPSKAMSLNIEMFNERYIRPAITTLAHRIDRDGLELVRDNIWTSTGTPGTAPTSVQAALNARALLGLNGCPIDKNLSIVLDPMTEASVVGGSLTLFHPSAELSSQYKKGSMGEAAGFEWFMDQNVETHSTGAIAGTPLIDTDSTDDTLHIDGITGSITGCYKAGDVLTIANVYSVNPQTKESTGQLMQFLVTEDTDSVTNEIAALPITPAIVTSGVGQNVTAAPVDGAAVKLFGAVTTYASKVSPVNVAFHKDAFVLAMVDLDLPDGAKGSRASDEDAGLSLRIVKDYDIVNDQNICRIDVLYGWKCVYPELACRIQG